MPTVKEVVSEPLRKKITALETSNQELRRRLAESKSRLDSDKVNLQAKVHTLTGQVVKFLKKESEAQKYVAEVKQAVLALDPLPAVPFILPDRHRSKTPITVVLHRTDWHIGEQNDSAEMEGWGGFNWSKAQDRVLNQLTPAFLEWLDTQRSGYNIKDLVILDTGDFISGDIHDELKITNEFPLPVQTAKAAQLLAQMTSELAPHFENITIRQIGGDNHRRLVKKPQAAQKVSNSMGSLVYEIHDALTTKHANVKAIRATGIKETVAIGNFKFLCEHGDSIKSWMGVPWYGIERMKAKEATRRMFDERGFHYYLMGHWHCPRFGDEIVGGCLGGTTPYDHSCGRVSSPAQTAFLVGKRGPFGFVPFKLR